MRPADLKNLVKRISFRARADWDKTLWIEVLRTQAQQEETARASARRPFWEIAMRNRTVKLTAAAVMLVAALAVGVETLRPDKPTKSYAFTAEIQANMALDLDPKAAAPLPEAKPGDFDVTWSSEEGGALKLVPGSSARLWRIAIINPTWDDAIGWTYSHLKEIQGSTATTVVPTDKTPFAAVLTSEGNLAVIHIGSRRETAAWLQWRVEKAVLPGYGPVQTVTLPSINEAGTTPQRCAIDLDTGQTVEIPAPVLHLPADDMLVWLEQHGVDAIARMSDDGDGLVGVGLVFWTWPPSDWTGTDPVNLRQEMARAGYQPRRPLLFEEDRYQYVFPFRTREGAVGMLQMLAVDKTNRTVQFRYRLLQEDGAGDTRTKDDVLSQQLSKSLKNLMRFGLLVFVYADHHDGVYPATLGELNDLAAKDHQDYQWIVDNVEYVGAGKTARDPNRGETILAYDKTLLKAGKGTNAVFCDSHAAFIEPKRFPEYGITPPK